MRVGVKKRNKITIIFSLIIGSMFLFGTLLYALYLNKNVNTGTEVILMDSAFEVKGMYGNTYSYSDIISIELKDTLPKITMRTNGAAIGSFKKGNFEVEGLGKCKLYLLSEAGPYLYIQMKDKYIIINFPEKEKTEALYQDLSKKI